MAYNNIVDPETGKQMSVFSSGGNNLISGYYNFLMKRPQSGGATTTEESDSNTVSPVETEEGVVDAVADSNDPVVEVEVVDANKIFNNNWSTEEFKSYMYGLPEYTDFEHHLEYKKTLDQMIESGINVISPEDDYQEFYLLMIQYLVKKCGGQMSVWKDVSGEKISVPILLEGSNDTDEIVQLQELLGGNLENIYLSREPRKIHSGVFPWSKLVTKLEDFKESLTQDVTAFVESEGNDPYLPEKHETESYIKYLEEYIGQIKRKAANAAVE